VNGISSTCPYNGHPEVNCCNQALTLIDPGAAGRFLDECNRDLSSTNHGKNRCEIAMTGATLSGFTVPDSKREWKIQEYGKTNRQNSAGNVYLGFS
jgi:hypothetical protein